MTLRNLKNRKNWKLSRKQSGDTLVEVMIAIAILSSVLAGCYSITRRALRISQASQDRIYGLKLLEGQVEMMRLFRERAAATSWSRIISDTASAGGAGRYCFDANDLLTVGAEAFAPKPFSAVNCSSLGPVGAEDRYRVVNRLENVGSGNVYVFRVEWEAINGGGEPVTEGSVTKYYDNAEYRYKLYDL